MFPLKVALRLACIKRRSLRVQTISCQHGLNSETAARRRKRTSTESPHVSTSGRSRHGPGSLMQALRVTARKCRPGGCLRRPWKAERLEERGRRQKNAVGKGGREGGPGGIKGVRTPTPGRPSSHRHLAMPSVQCRACDMGTWLPSLFQGRAPGAGCEGPKEECSWSHGRARPR